MKLGIEVKIDVTKIDKARLYQGEKGKYLTMTTFVDTDTKDEYGNNGFISESTTKEERLSGMQRPILGNVKVFHKDAQPGHAPVAAPANEYDDVPF